MDSIYTFFEFMVCSVMLGIAKMGIFNLSWPEKLGLRQPKKIKLIFYFQMIIGFVLFILCACYIQSSGHLTYLDLAATVVSGYFCGYVLLMLWTKRYGYVVLSLLVPVALVLAVIFQSVFWAIVAGVLVVVFFWVRRYILFGIEGVIKDRNATEALLKEVIAQEMKIDSSLLFSRRDILAFVANTLVENISDFKIKNYEEISEEMLWGDDLDLDEKDLYYMITLLEYNFIIKFEDNEVDLKKLRSIKDIIDLIEKKLS